VLAVHLAIAKPKVIIKVTIARSSSVNAAGIDQIFRIHEIEEIIYRDRSCTTHEVD
jgi:hypothetical protein